MGLVAVRLIAMGLVAMGLRPAAAGATALHLHVLLVQRMRHLPIAVRGRQLVLAAAVTALGGQAQLGTLSEAPHPVQLGHGAAGGPVILAFQGSEQVRLGVGILRHDLGWAVLCRTGEKTAGQTQSAHLQV